jgi:hypothetical protein
MAGANPFAKFAPAKGKTAMPAKPAAKKPMSVASAKAVANFVKGKAVTPGPSLVADTDNDED